MRPLIVASTVFWLFAATPLVRAQQRNTASDAELIQSLLTRIEQLEKRVADLEGPKASAAAQAQPPSPAAPPPTPQQMADMTHAVVEPAPEAGPNLKIAGF